MAEDPRSPGWAFSRFVELAKTNPECRMAFDIMQRDNLPLESALILVVETVAKERDRAVGLLTKSALAGNGLHGGFFSNAGALNDHSVDATDMVEISPAASSRR